MRTQAARRSRTPLWLVEGLDVAELRRAVLIGVAVLVSLVGMGLAFLAPGVVPPTLPVGLAVGFAALLLGYAAALAVDAADLTVRGPRHVRAAGGELVAVVPTDAEVDDARPLAQAVLEAREGEERILLGLAAAGRDARRTVAWADAVAVALAEEGVSVLCLDVASGRTDRDGLVEVVRDGRKIGAVVDFEDELLLARMGAGRDLTGALSVLPSLPGRLPRDLEVLLVALPTAASREVVAATRALDHVLVVAERDETARVDLVAALDALEAGGTTVQAMLVDDRTVTRLAGGTGGEETGRAADTAGGDAGSDPRARPDVGDEDPSGRHDREEATAATAPGAPPRAENEAASGPSDDDPAVDYRALPADAEPGGRSDRSTEPHVSPGGHNGRGVRVVSPVPSPEARVAGQDPAAMDDSATPLADGGGREPGPAEEADPLPAPGDPASATGPDVRTPAAGAPTPENDVPASFDASAPTDPEIDPAPEVEAEVRVPEHEVRPAAAPDIGWQTAGPDVPTGEVPAHELEAHDGRPLDPLSGRVGSPAADREDEPATDPASHEATEDPADRVVRRDVDVLSGADAARAAAWIEAEHAAAEHHEDPVEPAPSGDVAPLTSAWPTYDRHVSAEAVPSLVPHEDEPTDEVPEVAEDAARGEAVEGDVDEDAREIVARDAPPAWETTPVPTDAVTADDDPLHATAQLAILLDELHEREDDAGPGSRP
jgi:hypothetical protein